MNPSSCPRCDAANPEASGFCIQCGADLSEERSSKAPASARSAGTVPRGPADGLLSQEEPSREPGPVGRLSTGVIVDRKYSIEAVLGEGGMGVVYRARDIHTRVPVVIKAIRAEFAGQQEFRDRILAEGRALAQIDHANVVSLNAVVEEEGGLYLVMQFIEGESLDKSIDRYAERNTHMPYPEAKRVFLQVLDGVGAAHAEGVIHRDLKPANILIRARDKLAKVTDFGIAKAEEEAKAGKGQTKGIIGSLLYMAPEQIKGQRDLDKRLDIYGLGILLFEILTGKVPFDAPTEYEIMRMHLEGEIPSIEAIRDDVPRGIDGVVKRACAKDRALRFATTEELRDAIESLSLTLDVLPPRIIASSLMQTTLVDVKRPAKRGVGTFLVVLFLLGLVGGGAGFVWHFGWTGQALGRQDTLPAFPKSPEMPELKPLRFEDSRSTVPPK